MCIFINKICLDIPLSSLFPREYQSQPSLQPFLQQLFLMVGYLPVLKWLYDHRIQMTLQAYWFEFELILRSHEQIFLIVVSVIYFAFAMCSFLLLNYSTLIEFGVDLNSTRG